MPFKSVKQRKWMFANEPEMAKRWAKHESEGLEEMPKDGPGFGMKTTQSAGGAGRQGTGFSSGSPSFFKAVQRRNAQRAQAPDAVKNFLDRVKAQPVTSQEALALAKQVGMTKSAGINLDNKVFFLLKNFGEKGADGKWTITREIKPPYFSPQVSADPAQKSEMPHFDSDRGSIDLQIEKYPIPADEKGRLMRAFQKSGLVGELHGELLHFKPDHTVDVADEGMAARLPRLPADWLKYMKTVEDK